MSLETPEGMRFLALSELLDDAEAATLDAAGEPRAARIDPLRSFPDTGPPDRPQKPDHQQKIARRLPEYCIVPAPR
jgi:hypothetical protein